jgi:hypothetical protein
MISHGKLGTDIAGAAPGGVVERKDVSELIATHNLGVKYGGGSSYALVEPHLLKLVLATAAKGGPFSDLSADNVGAADLMAMRPVENVSAAAVGAFKTSSSQNTVPLMEHVSSSWFLVNSSEFPPGKLCAIANVEIVWSKTADGQLLLLFRANVDIAARAELLYNYDGQSAPKSQPPLSARRVRFQARTAPRSTERPTKRPAGAQAQSAPLMKAARIEGVTGSDDSSSSSDDSSTDDSSDGELDNVSALGEGEQPANAESELGGTRSSRVNNALQAIFTVRNAEKIHLQDFVQVPNDNYSSEFSRDEVASLRAWQMPTSPSRFSTCLTRRQSPRH